MKSPPDIPDAVSLKLSVYVNVRDPLGEVGDVAEETMGPTVSPYAAV